MVSDRPISIVTFLTGMPAMVLLFVWSIRYSMRGLAEVDPPAERTLAASAA